MVPQGLQNESLGLPKCSKVDPSGTQRQGAKPKHGVDIGIGIDNVPASTPNIDSLAIALGMEIGAMGVGK